MNLQSPDDVTSYAGLSLFSISLLYHRKILDYVQTTRQSLALGLAQQFFGCFITSTFPHIWLVRGLAKYVTIFCFYFYLKYITYMQSIYNVYQSIYNL